MLTVGGHDKNWFEEMVTTCSAPKANRDFSIHCATKHRKETCRDRVASRLLLPAGGSPTLLFGLKVSPLIFYLEKFYVTPPTIGSWLLNPPPIKSSIPHPNLSKTRQITHSSGFGGWFYLFYLFISNESSKNHKMENPILLDSTWVELHSEHITWYVLI